MVHVKKDCWLPFDIDLELKPSRCLGYSSIYIQYTTVQSIPWIYQSSQDLIQRTQQPPTMSAFLLHLPRSSTRVSSIRSQRLISSAPPSLSTTVQPKNTFRIFRNASLAAGLGLAAYTLGALFPPQPLTLLAPRPAPGPPPDINSPSSLEYTAKLESELQSLPLLRSLRSQPDADEWYETRPYRNFSEERRVNNFTAGALRGPGKLAFAPVVRVRKDESESVSILHVGRGLCGHDGIVHGGLLATLFDEGFGRTVRFYLH